MVPIILEHFLDNAECHAKMYYIQFIHHLSSSQKNMLSMSSIAGHP